MWVLVVLLFTNNIFYGKDAVPTIQFKTEQSCKDFITKIKVHSSEKTQYLCIKAD